MPPRPPGPPWSIACALVGLPRILGIVEPDNTASVRVLLKVGMTLQGETLWQGKAVHIYAIDKPQRGLT